MNREFIDAIACANLLSHVEHHAVALESLADAMASDGIGVAPGPSGHVTILRRIGHVRACAAKGELASWFAL